VFYQQFGIPASILDSVPTDTPAGRDARTLLELFLAVKDDGGNQFDSLATGFDLPDNLWCTDVSNLNIPEDEILNNPDNPLLTEAYAQRQCRMDAVVMILCPLLAPYKTVVVTTMTWGFIEFGRIGQELKGHGTSVPNPSFRVHLEQMERLGFRSPLL